MSTEHYLGIEIGGTKLQLGVGAGQGCSLLELIRDHVTASEGAPGIIAKVRRHAAALGSRHHLHGVGIGFGGPVDVANGTTTKSHQIHGWDRVPLCQMLRDELALPASIDNDCNVAALAEAHLGAGQGAARVFYITVGTGIGGGFVVDGQLFGADRPAVAEVGHLRPGFTAGDPEATVESIASGWGIAAWTRSVLQQKGPAALDAEALWQACGGDLPTLTTQQIGSAAADGDELARAALRRGTDALGWAIAQVVTLLAPEIVVVGGGVSLIGESFFAQITQQAARYVFAPLAGSYEIRPAALGEEVVVHGAILLARGKR